MGTNCSQCCAGFEKKIRQLSGEEEGELHIVPHRQMNHHNLSMVLEDAYESQLSQQNSYLGLTAQSATNVTNILNPLTDFWIFDIQERYIMASATNDSSLIYRISVQFNESTQEYCLIVEETAGPGSIHGSLNNSVLLKGTNNSTPTFSSKTKTAKNSNFQNNSKDNQGNLSSPNQANNISARSSLAGLQSRNLIYPLEKHVSDLYSKTFGNQVERIPDFGAEDGTAGVIEAWEAMLEKISAMLGIGFSSNVVIINNFMRFSRLENGYNTLQEKLLRFVFEKLLWQRFTLCSTGPAILKFANRKTGIVFDITSAGFVYCLPVGDGHSLDSSFRLLHYSVKTSKPPFLNEVTPASHTNIGIENNIDCVIVDNGVTADAENNKSNIDENSKNNTTQQHLENEKDKNNNNKSEKEPTIICLSPKDSAIPPEFSTQNNNNEDKESIGSKRKKSNSANNPQIDNDQNSQNAPKQKISPQSSTFSSEIAQFLASLDQDFLKSCFQSRSIVINNQSKIETVSTAIMQQLNVYFASTLSPTDDYFIPTPFQPIAPKQPHLSRLMGATDLIKLNVIETISNSKYERIGPSELLKENPFL